MLRLISTIAILVSASVVAPAAQRQAAFQAFATLPAETGSRLAMIAACEGTLQPERWHFLVHDPGAEGGLRDYVVADGRIVSANGVSQFAAELRPEDVLAPGSVHIDSDHVAVIAREYAAANRVSIASMNYELHKAALGEAPVWKVTCFDELEKPLGWLVIDAGDGDIVERGGFAPTPAFRQSSYGEPAIGERTEDVVGGFRSPSQRSKSDERPPANRSREIEVRRAQPVEPEPQPQRRRIIIDPFRVIRGLVPL